jgi:hypothetical protein
VNVPRFGVIEPATTLMDLYGPGHVYDPVPPAAASDWLRSDPSMLGLGIARKLPISGDLPMICPAAAATEAGLSLLEDVGLRRPQQLVVYDSEETYRQAVDDLVRRGTTMVFQHAQPPEAVPASAWWIAPELLAHLNNKGNLAKLAPEGNIPRRDTVPVAELRPDHPSVEQYPGFLKAVTDLSTGGGVAVRAYGSPAEFNEALEAFQGCETVIVEGAIEFERTFCVQFAALPDGATAYLGAAEQICDSNSYAGSWLDAAAEDDPGFVEVGTAIMDIAGAMGYRGIAGFDMGRDPTGRVVVFDLNFRINGSTTPLLLEDSVAAVRGMPIMRSSRYIGGGSFEDLLDAARRASDEGWFLPFATRAQDPKYPGSRPSIAGMIIGDTRESIMAHDAELRDRI